MNIKILKAAVVGLVLSVSGFANAGLIYVGSYVVTDGDTWPSNPDVYSAIEAAEVVFGAAVGGDYLISINGDDINDISLTAWYAVIGTGPSIFDQNYSLDTNLDGYGGSGWEAGDDVSAYVNDGFFSDLEGINYVFFETDAQIPEPSTLAIFGLALMGLASRRFKKQ